MKLCERALAMGTKAADAVVINLEAHPLWQSAQRYSEEVNAAMRRHPSFQSRQHGCDPT